MPDFVTTLTVAPAAPPYSAELELICTFTSWTDSSDGSKARVPPSKFMPSMPSK